jgi:tetratricopeptide (TPR) repeat protein
MEQDPEQPLDLSTGRELAVREGMPAVIAGEITAAGTGYVLTARVLTADQGEVLVSDRETADDDSELVSAINRLSKKLRERIGESLRDLAGGPPLERVTTGDLEALRLYSQAVRASERGENQQAADLLEETVARDSTFAMAWRKLGMIHVSGGGALGQMSRGVEALDRAYAFRDRLTERERHLATAGYHSYVERDDRRAATAYEQMLQSDPNDNWALNNLAIIVGPDFGEYERAVELLERAIATDTLSSTHHWNLSVAQANLGDFDGVQATLEGWRRRLPDNALAPGFQASLAAAQLDFETADHYAREVATIRPGNLLDQAFSHALLGWSAAVRGRVEAASGHFRDAEAVNRERGAPGEALGSAVRDAWLQQTLRNDPETAAARLEEALGRYPLEEMGPLDPPWDILSVAHAQIHGASGGDEMVLRWSEVDPNARYEDDHGFALAWFALADGDPAEAIRRFRDAETPECQPCAMPGLAAAFEATGQPDSAIVYYEEYLARPQLFRIVTDSRHLGPSVERLGQLYDGQGDLENAAKYYAMFVELWAEADEEFQPRVRAAQARLEEILAERG